MTTQTAIISRSTTGVPSNYQRPFEISFTLPGTQPLLPNNISNLTLWLDAADYSTLTFSSGNNVNTWRDKSGNNNTPTANASARPVYNSTGLNSRATVAFTATASPSTSTYMNASFSSTYTGFYLQCFIVCTHSASGNNFARLFSLSDGTANADLSTGAALPFCRNNGTAAIFNARGTNGAYFLSTAVAYDTPSILQSSQAPLSEAIGLNGTLSPSTIATPYSNAFAINSFAIGTNANLSDTLGSFTGNISEILYYTKQLTTTEIQQVEGYLAWKWGLQGNLPGGHPYSAAAPTIPANTLPSLPVSLPIFIFHKSWNPLIITGGLSLWLDAADTGTISYSTGTTNITQWNDKSGNGRNATAYFDPQPTTINGVPAIQLASADGTVKSNFDGSMTNGTNNVSIFAVCTNDKTSTNPFNRLVSLATFSTTIDAFTAGFAAAIILGGNNNYFGGQRNGIALYGSTNIISANVPLQVAAIWQNGAFALYVNGSLYYQNTYTPQGLFTYANYAIGRAIQNGFPGSNPTFLWNGKVGEVIMNNAIISEFQRQQTEGYLAWKWNLVGDLPLNHPFKKFPPAPP